MEGRNGNVSTKRRPRFVQRREPNLLELINLSNGILVLKGFAFNIVRIEFLTLETLFTGFGLSFVTRFVAHSV